jgi:hypothetical protein
VLPSKGNSKHMVIYVACGGFMYDKPTVPIVPSNCDSYIEKTLTGRRENRHELVNWLIDVTFGYSPGFQPCNSPLCWSQWPSGLRRRT